MHRQLTIEANVLRYFWIRRNMNTIEILIGVIIGFGIVFFATMHYIWRVARNEWERTGSDDLPYVSSDRCAYVVHLYRPVFTKEQGWVPPRAGIDVLMKASAFCRSINQPLILPAGNRLSSDESAFWSNVYSGFWAKHSHYLCPGNNSCVKFLLASDSDGVDLDNKQVYGVFESVLEHFEYSKRIHIFCIAPHTARLSSVWKKAIDESGISYDLVFHPIEGGNISDWFKYTWLTIFFACFPSGTRRQKLLGLNV